MCVCLGRNDDGWDRQTCRTGPSEQDNVFFDTGDVRLCEVRRGHGRVCGKVWSRPRRQRRLGTEIRQQNDIIVIGCGRLWIGGECLVWVFFLRHGTFFVATVNAWIVMVRYVGRKGKRYFCWMAGMDKKVRGSFILGDRQVCSYQQWIFGGWVRSYVFPLNMWRLNIARLCWF